jgi:hypothetical protein
VSTPATYVPAKPTVKAPPPSAGPSGLYRVLPMVTLIAVVTLTSTSEWHLARTVLDLPPAVAWSVPVAIDSYVIAAFHARRDIGPALAVMGGALLAATGSHLAAGLYPDGELPLLVTAPAAAIIMCVLVIVAWRVHVLIPTLNPTGTPGTATPAGAPRASTRGGTPRTPALTGDSQTTPRRSRDRGALLVRGLTDDQIIARCAGVSPGIRGLRRAYGIGQTRASRLNTTITAAKENPITETINETETLLLDKQIPPTQHMTATDTDNNSEFINHQNPKLNTHPGITDRVGPAGPLAEEIDKPGEAFMRSVGGA